MKISSASLDGPDDPRKALTSDIHLRGFDYWRSIAGSASLPLREAFEPADVPDLLPHLILLEVTENPIDFRYRVIGGVVRQHLLGNYTGRWISSIPHQAAPSTIHSNLAKAVRNRSPLLSDTPYIGPQKDFLKSDELILPLMEADERVSRLLVLLDFVRRPLEERFSGR
ncbi:PAS domain-containing protein [Nisaea acidiphila]|uniref:PAS domain-containing protein n=1 Tax=Nisaea acidiphila TaxID=1862145 RepID=A0A9J7AVV4_9PROT|nr:PAS domain-containing protein [Nisaea acidiphila]UUX51915.1 PAS domain-containing protein [Nisaea acidiphila]